jgi:hypothetical protein
MFEICPRCGGYSDRALVEDGRLRCPGCGASVPFKQLPLFYLSGASGAGKSTAARILYDTRSEFITMECDILWHERFNTPENGYSDFRDAWLRLAANYAQYGKSTLLCGCVTPDQVESRPRRRYFTEVHYIAIALSNDEFRRRGEKRGFQPEHMEASLNFNRWLRENGADRGMHIIDATDLTPEETADITAKIVLEHLK